MSMNSNSNVSQIISFQHNITCKKITRKEIAIIKLHQNLITKEEKFHYHNKLFDRLNGINNILQIYKQHV